jgi:hypothetical protein
MPDFMDAIQRRHLANQQIDDKCLTPAPIGKDRAYRQEIGL